MVANAEKNGAEWTQKDDQRITRIGKFIRKYRIDELPQLFNVLMGDMSLVGPRPERPEFVRIYVKVFLITMRGIVLNLELRVGHNSIIHMAALWKIHWKNLNMIFIM